MKEELTSKQLNVSPDTQRDTNHFLLFAVARLRGRFLPQLLLVQLIRLNPRWQ